MSAPLPSGYHFKIERRLKSGSYFMPNMEIYGDYYSFGYMLTGDRIIITPEKTALIHPGTIVFIHKNMPHRTAPGSSQDYENFSIKFKDCVVEKLIDTIGQQAFDRLFSQIAIHVTPAASEKILSLLSDMEEEWNHFDSYSNLMLESIFTWICITILRGQISELQPLSSSPSRHQLLFEAIRYMELNFSSDPSLLQTAQEIHVSPGHLSRLFTSNLESSYSDFLTMIKINHAQKLLMETSLPILEVAAQSGFSNSNYFCDVFKKKLGISPSKLRKEPLTHMPAAPK
jgi:Response regulator containing CheY-like receiver domain and AraC-type DNA-binding domain